MDLHWHRQDLRVSDNRGLAAGDGETAGLFVLDPAILDHAGPPRVAFLLDALDSLSGQYRDRGSDLLVAEGDPQRVVPAVSTALDADRVTWCRDYTGLARDRDAAVADTLDDAGVEPSTFHDAVLHEPGSITTVDGDPYQVFSYYGKKWLDREKPAPVQTPDADRFVSDGDLDPARELDAILGSMPETDMLGVAAPEASVPAASTEAARSLLSAFCAEDIYRYADCRDSPAEDCPSGLSPHLTFGTIGIREVFARTAAAKRDATTETASESVGEFQAQLAWREFYTQVLWDRPDAVTENYREFDNPIQWRADEAALQAWKDGETGYPLVDAGMRQLRREARMHNRVRMVVASFLTKDLLLDWRAGYAWFREKLVDHDSANDSGGWQWAASTGTDAQPYFRVFNPMTQAERYDPEGTYIREYVPELADAPTETIHEWHELDAAERNRHAPDYPAPIVDHAERREAAIAMFERARGEAAE